MDEHDGFKTNEVAMPDTEWTRMQATVTSIMRKHATSFIEMATKREEFRCTQETALKVKEGLANSRPSYFQTFGAALGVPLVVSKDVPEGKLQFWRGNEMVREIDIA